MKLGEAIDVSASAPSAATQTPIDKFHLLFDRFRQAGCPLDSARYLFVNDASTEFRATSGKRCWHSWRRMWIAHAIQRVGLNSGTAFAGTVR
jgi:hypothetical protein